MNCIIGYTGFVGSNLLQFYSFDEYYNSKNFKEIKDKEFDTIFFTAIPAVKWIANKYPKEDEERIDKIKKILDTVQCKTFILISSIDVYDNTSDSMNEDSIINYDKNHTYGKNRYLFEKYIEKKFTNHYIIRLPALFGKGLKKNIIYDLFYKNEIHKIPFYSTFQWYNLDWLKNDIDRIMKHKIKVYNLFTEPIKTSDIIHLYDSLFHTNYSYIIEHYGVNENRIIYNIQTKYSTIFNSSVQNYIRDKEKVLESLKDFLISLKRKTSHLSISNICIQKLNPIHFYQLLKLYNIQRIQIAPTKLISEWNELENLSLSSELETFQLKPYSLQSITYGLDSLNIFNENSNQLKNHIKKIIDYASQQDIQFLVFGCPKNRKITEDTEEEKFIHFFKEIGDYCQTKNIILSIENNSRKYGCNFLTTIHDCERIIRKINHPSIKIMVDIGNSIMENDKDWFLLKNKKDIIYNIDISNEYMEDFSTLKEFHPIFNYVLEKNDLKKNINLEMLVKEESIEEELKKINTSIQNFIQCYGIDELSI